MRTNDELAKLGFSKAAIDAPAPKQTVEDIRKRADRLLLRALADPQFRDSLKSDPAKVFVQAGLPVGAVEDLERQLDIDGQLLAGSCTVTCISTCWWTDWF